MLRGTPAVFQWAFIFWPVLDKGTSSAMTAMMPSSYRVGQNWLDYFVVDWQAYTSLSYQALFGVCQNFVEDKTFFSSVLPKKHPFKLKDREYRPAPICALNSFFCGFTVSLYTMTWYVYVQTPRSLAFTENFFV